MSSNKLFKMFNKHIEDRCVIRRYKASEISPFTEEEEDRQKAEVIYDGRCNVQIPLTIRTFSNNGVVKKDDAIYIPYCVEAYEGDLIDIYPKHGRAWKDVPVTKVSASHFHDQPEGTVDPETGLQVGVTTIVVNIPVN